jgi:hypothetical protein
MLDARIALRHSLAVVQPNRFMTNPTGNRLWFILFFAVSCNFCFAQPSGQFTLDFDNSTPLIDMSGDFSVSDQILGAGDQPVPLNFTVGINHRSNGALRASSTTAILRIGNDFVPAFYHANGRVSGGGNNQVRVFLALKFRGQGTVAGVVTTFNISVAYNLLFNQESGALEGASRGSAKLSRVGGGRIHSDEISVGLPGGGDGSWSIIMNVVPFKHLSGTAQVVLSGGRQLNGNLGGHFFEGSGFSLLRFTGTTVDRGSTATFSFITTDEDTELETVRGRILGQRVLF